MRETLARRLRNGARPASRLAFAAALLPAACAAPAPEPPLPYPPAARQRMLRIALDEWRDWGGLVAEPGGGGDPAAEAEARPENFPRVLAYWRALDDDEGAVARNRPLYRAALAGEPRGEALWRQPFWSAAFVSYVLRAAGVDRTEFPPAPSHAAYVDALIGNAARFPATAPFLPHAPGDRAPLPGDLICADRSGDRAAITDWRQRAADGGRFRPMHCDIVVASAPGVVEAIGGNVRDAVTLTRFPADGSGYLMPQAPGAPVWFAVFENRLGCLPPWGPCPTGTAVPAVPLAAAPGATAVAGARPVPGLPQRPPSPAPRRPGSPPS
jgi:Uncharacterized protein conserved in bacteria (DUF2272)